MGEHALREGTSLDSSQYLCYPPNVGGHVRKGRSRNQSEPGHAKKNGILTDSCAGVEEGPESQAPGC